jgi:hypothetical protein
MDLFTQLFGGMLAFVYHCFDRIVIYGYLSGLSRPERVVNFFRQVAGDALTTSHCGPLMKAFRVFCGLMLPTAPPSAASASICVVVRGVSTISNHTQVATVGIRRRKVLRHRPSQRHYQGCHAVNPAAA